MKRSNPKPPAELVTELVAEIRTRFYANRDEQRFWYERPLLVKAITHPAAVLSLTGATLPWENYRRVLTTVMVTIEEHGDTANVRNFGQYFLKAVQSHMAHHRDRYYEEAKRLSNAVDTAMQGAQAAEIRPDSTVADLAKLHSAVQPKGGRRKSGQPDQLSLF